jgi:transcriptional regulator
MSVDRERAAARRLIGEYPLAWVVSRRFNASPLPLLAEVDDQGAIVALFGHCARSNPLCADFVDDAGGLVLFNGPAGYISPRLVSERDWAPTWNYAVLRFTVEVEFVPDETRSSVERLLSRLEGDGPDRWTTAELGARYERLLERVVAFRAHVRSFAPTFKLGQDERGDLFGEITSRHSNTALVEWMEDFAERTGA